MNILFVDQYSEIGGAQRCFLDLLPAIRDSGWTVHAVLPGDGPFAGQLRAAQTSVTRIPCGPYQSVTKSATDFARFPFDFTAQVRTIRRQPADLIYVNGPRVLPGACLASIGRAPVLFHAHNRLNHVYETRLARWSLRASRSTVVACSEFVAEPLPGSIVAPNGTPDMGFRERRFDPSRLRIGMIGRPSPQKGLATFVQVARSFPQAKFVAVGQGVPSGPLLSAGGESSVDFQGWRDDINAVLAGLDLLLIPSQQEGLPRVMLEAFSAGVPVIAFPAGGIVEAIRHGETGFLTKEFSAEAMTATIRTSVADTAALQCIAANARHLWEQCYNVTLYRRRLIDLMQQVVSEHRPVCETAPLRQRT
jgi:glycosyltransferase involved in cell wall biosynthesis